MNIIVIVVIVVLILYLIGRKMEGKDNSYEKTREWLIKSRDVFNDITLRFNKCGYPITDYLEALYNSYEKGLKPLSNEALNFYLSYPKKYEVKNNHLFVNNVDLGLANECVLFNKQSFTANKNMWDLINDKAIEQYNYKTMLGEKFFIKNYVINENYTSFMGEIDARTGSVPNCKDRLYKEIPNEFKNIEKESKDNLDRFSKKFGVSMEVMDLINDLSVCHDIAECQDKINKFSEYARENYEDKEFIESFNNEYKKSLSKTFNKHYIKGSQRSRGTDVYAFCKQDAERMNLDKNIIEDCSIGYASQLNDNGYSRLDLEKKYANILVGVERFYKMENEK